MHDAPRPESKPRLLEQVRLAIRRLHYSLRTEDTYLHWIRRFIFFHGKRHPRDLGAAEVTAFLNHLARARRPGAGAQTGPRSHRAHRLGGTAPALASLRGQMADGESALRRRPSPSRMPEAESQGHRLRISSDHRAGRQRGERLRHASPGLGRSGLQRTSRAREASSRARSHRGIRRRGAARCAAREVPPRGVRMGLEVRFSFVQALGRSPHRRHQAPSRLRKLSRSRGEAGRTRRRDCEARELSYVEALFCDAPPRERLRHPHGPGAARPRERRDDDDLHARDEQGRAGSEKPARPAGAAARGVSRALTRWRRSLSAFFGTGFGAGRSRPAVLDESGATCAKAGNDAESHHTERCCLSFSFCALIAARAFSQSASLQANSSLNEPPLTRQAAPSSAMVWPVRNSQPSAMRNAARFCSSSIFPARRIGLTAAASLPASRPGARRLPAPSVGKIPGAMALTRIPWRPHSTASDCVMTCTPAFDIAEGTTNGDPVHTQVTTIEMTEPLWPPAIQRLPT